MVITIALSLIYAAGLCGTVLQQIDENIEWEIEQAVLDDDRELPSIWLMIAISIWTVVVGVIWPAYWTGRALYAVPERLALNPGEPQ